MIYHVQQQYQFQEVYIQILHIGYGLAAKILADNEIYYLKFASRNIHDNPNQLFPWLNYLRSKGISLAKVIPAIN